MLERRTPKGRPHLAAAFAVDRQPCSVGTLPLLVVGGPRPGLAGVAAPAPWSRRRGVWHGSGQFVQGLQDALVPLLLMRGRYCFLRGGWGEGDTTGKKWLREA